MDLLDQLAQQLKLSRVQVTDYLVTAPLKYKVYRIPKRRYGSRLIAQPAKTLKEFQRAFLEIHPLPVHEAATAYRKSFGIRENARQHQGNNYLLKLDLNDFFNSITPELFWQCWQEFYGLPAARTKELLERLLFWSPGRALHQRLVLSVGAPSSPQISNFLMYRFDQAVHELAHTHAVCYTRYADDLTFSTNERGRLFEYPQIVSQKLQKYYAHALVINQRKTVFSSKAHNRHITGITITNEGRLSLGRQRKRYLRHLVHYYQLQRLSVSQVELLQGWLAFAQHIEPQFIRSLEKKYTKQLINQIRTGAAKSKD